MLFKVAFHGGLGNFWNALMTVPEVRTKLGLHALWYIRVFDLNPVLKLKGIFGVFEYSRPL